MAKNKEPLVQPNVKLMEFKSIDEPMNESEVENNKNLPTDESQKQPKHGEQSISKHVKQLIAQKVNFKKPTVEPNAKQMHNKSVGETMDKPVDKSVENLRSEELFKRSLAARGEQSITKHVKLLIAKKSEPRIARIVAFQNLKEVKVMPNAENNKFTGEPLNEPEKKDDLSKKPLANRGELSITKNVKHLIAKNVVEERSVKMPLVRGIVRVKKQYIKEPLHRSAPKHVKQLISKNVKQLIAKNVMKKKARNEEQLIDELEAKELSQETISQNAELENTKSSEESMEKSISIHEEENLVEESMVQRSMAKRHESDEVSLELSTAEQVTPSVTNVQHLTVEDVGLEIARRAEYPMTEELTNGAVRESMLQPNDEPMKEKPSEEPLIHPKNVWVEEEPGERTMIQQIVKKRDLKFEDLLEHYRATRVENQPTDDPMNVPTTHGVKQLTTWDAELMISKNVNQSMDKFVAVESDKESTIQLNTELTNEPLKSHANNIHDEEEEVEEIGHISKLINPFSEELQEQLKDVQVKHQPNKDRMNQCPDLHVEQSTARNPKQLIPTNLEQPVDKHATNHSIELNAELEDDPFKDPTKTPEITIQVEDEDEGSIGHILDVTIPPTEELFEQPRAKHLNQQVSKNVGQPIDKYVTNEPDENDTIELNAELADRPSKEHTKTPEIISYVEEKVIEGPSAHILKVTNLHIEGNSDQPCTKHVAYQSPEYTLNQKNTQIVEMPIFKDVEEEPLSLHSRRDLEKAPLEQLVLDDDESIVQAMKRLVLEDNEEHIEQAVAENMKKSATRRKRGRGRKQSTGSELSSLGIAETSSAEYLSPKEDQSRMERQPSPSTSRLQISSSMLRPQTMHFTKEHSEEFEESADHQYVAVRKESIDEPENLPEAISAAILPRHNESTPSLSSGDSEEDIEIPIGWQHVEIRKELIEDSIKQSIGKMFEQPFPRSFREKPKQRQVEKINADGTILVNFMGRSSHKRQFVWPRVPDRRVLWPEDVLYALAHPPVQVRAKHYGVKEYSYIDWLSKPYDGTIAPF
ncbi:hypothetical protein GE061_013517 [Apolygus lucorum]|uniref:Uncharacterized protein n=1 Tax=Apolygus lucorum TaxID=248454 RepID=A0A8S9XQ26_APOLU|nr:hypothetical protein GE061_013517 [Apolygus lucorum]